MCIQRLDFAGFEVHAFNASALIILCLIPWKNAATPFDPIEATIVANVAVASGSDCGAIGTATDLSDYIGAAIRQNPSKGCAFDFDQDDRTVWHRDRTFGET